MNSAGRALIGALLGALITLAAHPASRPFLLGSVNRATPAMLESSISTEAAVLSPPTDVQSASLWLQVGMDRLRDGRGLSSEERNSLLQVVEAAALKEVGNAYWPQMATVLLLDAGRMQDAQSAWSRASRLTSWKDYQSERLLQSRRELAAQAGAEQAWQLAFVYYARSESSGIMIERAARKLLAQADYESDLGREVRYATLLNGDLLRSGGRSVRVSRHGANIVELAAYPADLTATITPKRLWVGQTSLLASFAESGMDVAHDRANKIFRANEGWRALVYQEERDQTMQQYAMATVVAAALPVALLATSVVGFVILGIGLLIQASMRHARSFPMALTGFVSVSLALLVYGLSERPVAALAVSLCSAFILVAPAHARRIQPSDLGPLFTFVVLALAVASAGAVAAHAVTNAPPLVSLAPVLGVPHEFQDRPSFIALGFVLASLLFLVSPLWALVYRMGTPYVVGTALRRFGAILGWGGITATIVLGPAAVFADRTMSQALEQIVANEPVYYLQQYEP
jgi:hypothetical protein